MSTAATGVGTIGIASVLALPVILLGACAAGVYSAVKALDKMDKNLLVKLRKNAEALKQELTVFTAENIKSKFIKDYAIFKDLMKPFKLTAVEQTKYAQAFALETTGLGNFLSPEKVSLLKKTENISDKQSKEILSSAIGNFKTASFDYAKKSIVEAAQESGFNHKFTVKKHAFGTHITAINSLGQAVVVLARMTDKGLSIKADTTGFTNGACTTVVKEFVGKLAKKHIIINNLKIKEHWKKEGILNAFLDSINKQVSSPQSEQRVKKEQVLKKKKDARRRIQNSSNNLNLN